MDNEEAVSVNERKRKQNCSLLTMKSLFLSSLTDGNSPLTLLGTVWRRIAERGLYAQRGLPIGGAESFSA